MNLRTSTRPSTSTTRDIRSSGPSSPEKTGATATWMTCWSNREQPTPPPCAPTGRPDRRPGSTRPGCRASGTANLYARHPYVVVGYRRLSGAEELCWSRYRIYKSSCRRTPENVPQRASANDAAGEGRGFLLSCVTRWRCAKEVQDITKQPCH